MRLFFQSYAEQSQRGRAQLFVIMIHAIKSHRVVASLKSSGVRVRKPFVRGGTRHSRRLSRVTPAQCLLAADSRRAITSQAFRTILEANFFCNGNIRILYGISHIFALFLLDVNCIFNYLLSLPPHVWVILRMVTYELFF